jgi:hypothetical protein
VSFLHILEPTETFWHRPVDRQSGEPSDSRLQLRVLDDEDLTRFRKRATKTAFKHGQRVEDFDPVAFAADVVDHAIVAWENVKRGRTEEVLPCERVYKLLLPERVQAEIIRLCAGKEAGDALEEEAPKNASVPSLSGRPTNAAA